MDFSLLYDLRRTLHAHPEPAGQEKQTQAILQNFLKQHTSLKIHAYGSFFTALHEEGPDCPLVVFRGDMDAIAGTDGSFYHGCGHDGHSAILAGLGLALEGKKLGHNVCLLFQPAEETGQGGPLCAPYLKKWKPQAVYGFHNLPGYPAGQILLREGTFACASKGLILNFTGKRSHAANPEKGRNPALAMGQFLTALPTLTDPANFSDLVMATVVEVQLGSPDFGISAGEGRICLTLRGRQPEDFSKLEQNILQTAENLAFHHKLSFSHTSRDVFPATCNDKNLVQTCRQMLETQNLPFSVLPEPMGWSEDFGWYGHYAPSLYLGIGAGETCPPLHTAEYAFPDPIIPMALSVLSGLAAL